MKFRIFVGKQKDGNFTAECSSLHDCSTEGKTKKELFENMENAINHHISKKRRNIEPSYDKKFLK
jgi:predicted RNase H-like HicB family nuclease